MAKIKKKQCIDQCDIAARRNFSSQHWLPNMPNDVKEAFSKFSANPCRNKSIFTFLSGLPNIYYVLAQGTRLLRRHQLKKYTWEYCHCFTKGLNQLFDRLKDEEKDAITEQKVTINKVLVYFGSVVVKYLPSVKKHKKEKVQKQAEIQKQQTEDAKLLIGAMQKLVA